MGRSDSGLLVSKGLGVRMKGSDSLVGSVCCFKLKGGKFKLDIRKKFFIIMVVNLFNKLLREVPCSWTQKF